MLPSAKLAGPDRRGDRRDRRRARSAAAATTPAQPIPREKYPRILFIWGLDPRAAGDDRLDDASPSWNTTSLLNPMRAEVDITLSVIAVDECSDDVLAKGALEYSTIAKEAQAIANLANTAEQIVDLIPL